MQIVSPPGYRVIEYREAEPRFNLRPDLIAGRVGANDGGYGQPIRLYENGLHVDGDFVVHDGTETCTDNVIVVGDLTVDGTLKWSHEDEEPFQFLVVTGDLRAAAVLLGERVEVVVRGDTHVTGNVGVDSRLENPWDGDSRLATRNVNARSMTLTGHADVLVIGDLVLTDGIWCVSLDDCGSLIVTGRFVAKALLTSDHFTITLLGAVPPEPQCLTLVPSEF